MAQRKKRDARHYARVNGNCKMAKLTDGYLPRACPECGTVHKLKKCPWCGHVRKRGE